MTEPARHPEIQPTASDIRLVIAASSAGTIFEWYDFFIYGTLGAILFGYLGDKLGRKYTFLVTVTLMGIATAGVGFLPSATSIGMAAPVIIILLRILQGLALGGEYGGAAIYVAEHSPPGKRGYFTSFIQASVVGGFVLSLVVVLSCKALMSAETWAAWGWRVPFILSIALLAISLWMRLKLSESPVFRAMQEEGELAGNPFIESMTYPGNPKRLFVALFGIGAGLTVIWYTAMFYGLSFLKTSVRLEDTTAEIMAGLSAGLGMVFFIYFGKMSDKWGRKRSIVWGYALTLVPLFPIFWGISSFGNPQLAATAQRAPVAVAGPDCQFDPFAAKQKTNCGKLIADLAATGVTYSLSDASALSLTVGGKALPVATDYAWDDSAKRAGQLKQWLAAEGYKLDKIKPSWGQLAKIFGCMFLLMALSGATYGPVAALLTEMFPPHIRYSSMSIPYHFGTGYFGGFLPLIAALIVAKTGDPFAGLWYAWGVTLVALVIAMWGLKGGPPRDFSDNDA